MKIIRTLMTCVCVTIFAFSATTRAEATPTDQTDPALTQTVQADENMAPRGEQVVLSQGHIDVAPRYKDNTWEVLVRDDSGSEPVWRHPDDLVFAVSDTAKLDVPQSPEYEFIGATQSWVVPQQEIAGIPWIGWNTQDPGVVQAVPASVDIVYEGHEGPGRFTAFVQAGNFKGPDLLWSSEKEQSQPITVDVNTHTHANWVFTEAGIHRVKLAFTATLEDGTTVGGKVALTFAVGSQTQAEDAFAQTEASSAQSDESSEQDHEHVSNQSSRQETPSGQSPVVVTVIGGAVGLIVLAAVVGMWAKKSSERRKKEALQ